MKENIYEQPQIEIFAIEVEQGFAASGLSTTTSAGGDYIQDQSDIHSF